MSRLMSRLTSDCSETTATSSCLGILMIVLMVAGLLSTMVYHPGSVFIVDGLGPGSSRLLCCSKGSHIRVLQQS